MSEGNLNLPPRWLKCPRRGNIVGEKFIPFKTPLDDKYSSQIQPQDLFTPQMFISCLNGLKIKLGLWIDLTYTSRFYDKSLVESNQIRYVKFQCRGHDECPTRDQVKTFIEICHNFISKNPLEAIAVHCTHGFNRTGFLICAYLIEILDWSVEASVSAFAKCRPPGIYKQDYINELFNRYEDIDDTFPAPPLPEWCLEYDDNKDDEGETVNGHNDNGSRRYRGNQIMKTIFMEGVEGVEPVKDMNEISQVQQMCQEMCSWKRGFPGSQPVSMDRKNIEYLKLRPYKVSWKADGNRYMMLVKKKDKIYFIDRDNCVFIISGLTFPQRKHPDRHLERTLLDGEMIIDEVDGVKMPKFLIYDIVKFDTQKVGGCDFDRRLLCIDKEIISPREEAKKNGRIDRNTEPFSVRKKEFWDVYMARSLFGENFTRNLKHEIDGLIFQPCLDPYHPGRCDAVLKWKPDNMNSVDFKLKIVTENRPGMLRNKVGYLYVGGQDQPFDQIKVSKELRELDNKIIECTFDKTCNQWKLMRERTDKSHPNSYNTAMAVCESIKFPVTKEFLLDFIEHHRWMPSVTGGDGLGYGGAPASGSNKRSHAQVDHHEQSKDTSLMPPPRIPRK